MVWKRADGTELARTETLYNVLGANLGLTPTARIEPAWKGTYAGKYAEYAPPLSASRGIVVEVWDSDRGEDDLIGRASFELDEASADSEFEQRVELVLKDVPGGRRSWSSRPIAACSHDGPTTQ